MYIYIYHILPGTVTCDPSHPFDSMVFPLWSSHESMVLPGMVLKPCKTYWDFSYLHLNWWVSPSTQIHEEWVQGIHSPKKVLAFKRPSTVNSAVKRPWWFAHLEFCFLFIQLFLRTMDSMDDGNVAGDRTRCVVWVFLAVKPEAIRKILNNFSNKTKPFQPFPTIMDSLSLLLPSIHRNPCCVGCYGNPQWHPRDPTWLQHHRWRLQPQQ